MKKLISIALAIMLLASLCTVAFAADPTGSITINGVSTDNTYEIYRLLNLSLSEDGTAYTYTVNPKWAAFFATVEAKKVITVNPDNNVATWTGPEDDDTKAQFAKDALAFAEANGITADKSSKNAGEFVITGTSGKFSDLPLGYYLVDSTVGALCGLTTTNLHASVNAKNGIPTVDKQVNEDSTAQWGDINTADIGQIIEYRVTINVHAGAQNYVLHDTMSAGLTFQGVSKVEHVIPGLETHVTSADKYTVKTGADTECGCTFEVHFSKEFCDSLETNDKVIISYSAMLNRNAVVAGAGNKNSAHLEFGEGNESNTDDVTTYTFGIDVVKTDDKNNKLDGATFKIYDAAEGGNEIAVVLTDDASGYRRARPDETGVAIVVKNGEIRVSGFDNGTYYLEEIAPPEGYNKLTTRQKFIIADANLDAVYNDGVFSTGSGVHVVNKTGSMLPETGGLGTLLFTLLGGSTVLGTGVVLVTKKRMSKIEDEE